MSDLISREALIETLVKADKTYNNEAHGGYVVSRDVIDEVRYAPSVDAVEVVRCKDCKYYKTALCTNEDNHSSFYCADGERKEVRECES